MSLTRLRLSTRFAHILSIVFLFLGSVCAAQTVIATIPATDPQQLDVNPFTRLVYVADAGTGTVSVISEQTNAVIEIISVGVDPVGVAVNLSAMETPELGNTLGNNLA